MPASRRGTGQVEEVVAGERARGEEGKGIQGRAEQSRDLCLLGLVWFGLLGCRLHSWLPQLITVNPPLSL